MSSLFTADWHLAHPAILKLARRDFADLDEMTEAFIERHNAVARPNDTTFHLGDFAMREQVIEGVLKRLNGTHVLVPGNHDRCFRSHRGAEKAKRRYIAYGFARVEQRMTVDLGGQHVMLSHLPYRIEQDSDQRYAQFRPIDRGMWLLCGHVHLRWAQLKRMINVGVDVHGYRPVHEDTVLEIIRHARAA